MPFPPMPESPNRRPLLPEQPPRTHRGGGIHIPPSSFSGRASAAASASGSGTPRVGMHLFTKPRNHHSDSDGYDDDDVSVLTFSTVTTGKNSHARSYVENLAKESLEKVMSGRMDGTLERDEEEENEKDREDDWDDRGRILTRLSEEGSSGSQGGSSSEITRRSAVKERCDRDDGRSSDERKSNDTIEKGREHEKEKEKEVEEEDDDDDDDDTLSLAESVLSNANEVLMKLSASPYAKNIRNKHNTNTPKRNLLPPPSTSISSSSSSFAVDNVKTSSPYKKTNILGDAKGTPRESSPNPHARDKYLAAATNIYSPTSKTSRIGDTHSFWNRWNDENISRASNLGDSNDRGGKNDRKASFTSSKSLSPSKRSSGSTSTYRYIDNVKDNESKSDNRKNYTDYDNNASENNNNEKNNNDNNNSRTSFLFETNNDHSNRSTDNHTSLDGDILQKKSSTITIPKLRADDNKLKRLQAEKEKCQRELEECQSKSKEAKNALDASITRAKLLLEKMMMTAHSNTTDSRDEVAVRDGGDVVSC